MTNEAFKKGFAALTATFPQMNFNGNIFWAMLNDLDGQFFLMAVWDFIKTTKELFPGTNVVANLRERTLALQDKARQENTLKLTAETEKERVERWGREAVPMPEDCKQEFLKLGLKLPHPKEVATADDNHTKRIRND